MKFLLVIVLSLLALINLARGGIHVFAPDGGAGTIAGLDLATDAQTILSLFAIIGLGQIVWGLFQVFVVMFRRDLMVLALSLQTLSTGFGVANLYFYRSLPVEVPGQLFNTVLLAIMLAVLAVYGINRWRNRHHMPAAN